MGRGSVDCLSENVSFSNTRVETGHKLEFSLIQAVTPFMMRASIAPSLESNSHERVARLQAPVRELEGPVGGG